MKLSSIPFPDKNLPKDFHYGKDFKRDINQ